MNKHAKIGNEFETLKELVSAAFPDLSCLRCANKDFFLKGMIGGIGLGRIASGAPEHSYEETIKLVCQTCGFVEEHSIKPLLEASKPIKGK